MVRRVHLRLLSFRCMSQPEQFWDRAFIGRETSRTEPQDLHTREGAWRLELMWSLCYRLSELSTEEVNRALFTASIAMCTRDEDTHLTTIFGV